MASLSHQKVIGRQSVRPRGPSAHSRNRQSTRPTPVRPQGGRARARQALRSSCEGATSDKGGLMSMRTFVITAFAFVVSVLLGGATGIVAGIQTGVYANLAIAITVGVMMGAGSAAVAGLAVAKGLHKLID